MKIDLIEECGDCSNREYKCNTLICSITKNETTTTSMPVWCPLFTVNPGNIIQIDTNLLIQRIT